MSCPSLYGFLTTINYTDIDLANVGVIYLDILVLSFTISIFRVLVDPFQMVCDPAVNAGEVHFRTAVLSPGALFPGAPAPGDHSYQPRLAILPVVEAAPAVATAGVRPRHIVVQLILPILVQPEVVSLVLKVDIASSWRLFKFLDGFKFFLQSSTQVKFAPELVIPGSGELLAVFHWKQTQLGFLHNSLIMVLTNNKISLQRCGQHIFFVGNGPLLILATVTLTPTPAPATNGLTPTICGAAMVTVL